MMMLLIAGFGILLVGLVAIGFGIPVHEFSFGNTLILAGAVAACTGVLLLGLHIVVRELKDALRPRDLSGTEIASLPSSLPNDTGFREQPGTEEPAFGHKPDATGHEADAAAPAGPGNEPDIVASSDSASSDATTAKPRRNLLFASSSRKERERAAAKTPGEGSGETSKEMPSPPPIPAKNAPSATFDDAWPASERGRSDGVPPRVRMPSTFDEKKTATPDLYGRPRSTDQPPVTVLKSGIVDGMAYSLYSDGSIEAQMPEGMMRFASIDELRSHLDQRP